jgi:hypothetical protein
LEFGQLWLAEFAEHPIIKGDVVDGHTFIGETLFENTAARAAIDF